MCILKQKEEDNRSKLSPVDESSGKALKFFLRAFLWLDTTLLIPLKTKCFLQEFILLLPDDQILKQTT